MDIYSLGESRKSFSVYFRFSLLKQLGGGNASSFQLFTSRSHEPWFFFKGLKWFYPMYTSHSCRFFFLLLF